MVLSDVYGKRHANRKERIRLLAQSGVGGGYQREKGQGCLREGGGLFWLTNTPRKDDGSCGCL